MKKDLSIYVILFISYVCSNLAILHTFYSKFNQLQLNLVAIKDTLNLPMYKMIILIVIMTVMMSMILILIYLIIYHIYLNIINIKIALSLIYVTVIISFTLTNMIFIIGMQIFDNVTLLIIGCSIIDFIVFCLLLTDRLKSIKLSLYVSVFKLPFIIVNSIMILYLNDYMTTFLHK